MVINNTPTGTCFNCNKKAVKKFAMKKKGFKTGSFFELCEDCLNVLIKKLAEEN